MGSEDEVMKPKWGWKAVSEFRTSIWSTVSLKYKINKWTIPHPGDGPLAVFSSYRLAKSFVENVACYGLIYKCKYFQSESNLMWKLVKYWEGNVWHNSPHYAETPYPKGTVFADKVMIVGKPR